MNTPALQSPHQALIPVRGDDRIVKSAFGHFPTGVAAICAEVDGGKVGLIASTFTVGVSLSPPYVSVALQNTSTTWPVLRQSRRLGVSVLSSAQGDACNQIAAKGGDRFAGLQTMVSELGSVFIMGASLSLDCELVQEVPAGDHCVALLEVKGVMVDESAEPLLYHRAQLRKVGLLAG